MTRATLTTALALSLLAAPAFAQDEPGAPTKGAKAGASDPLAAAEASCKAGTPCPHFTVLVRALHDPKRGIRALAVLARLGDPRAAPAVARVIVYGSTPELRQAAKAALAELAKRPSSAQAVQSVAASNADPAVATAARAVLGSRFIPPPAGRGAQGGAPGPGGAGGQPAAPKSRAYQRNRVIYGSTALAREPGPSWTVYNLGFHTLDWSINENLEVGFGMLVPIAVYAFVPRVKLMIHPTENVHLGVQAVVPIVGSYVEGGGGVVAFGGGPILTIGNEKFLFNASLLIGGARGFSGVGSGGTGWAMAPSIGASFQVHRAIRLNVEAYAPIAQDSDVNGEIWLILYGLRITGEHLFGDVSFVIPVFPGVGEVLKYVPLGFPLLTLGYQW